MQVIEANWSAPQNVRAFSTVREGGVSERPFASFNLGDHVGDEPAAVEKNRILLSDEFALPGEPIWLQQTHSTRIIECENQQVPRPGQIDADGIFCQSPGQVCVIMTADCMPLLLCNSSGTKVAALHAGWRGLADGIIERGVSMFNESPENILAYAGPCISQKHFEIGIDVQTQMGGAESAYRCGDTPEKCYADLYALAGQRLADVGVSQYSHHQYCTYEDEALFFSYRRDGQCGRMATLIWSTQ